MKTQIPGDIFT